MICFSMFVPVVSFYTNFTVMAGLREIMEKLGTAQPPLLKINKNSYPSGECD